MATRSEVMRLDIVVESGQANAELGKFEQKVDKTAKGVKKSTDAIVGKPGAGGSGISGVSSVITYLGKTAPGALGEVGRAASKVGRAASALPAAFGLAAVAVTAFVYGIKLAVQAISAFVREAIKLRAARVEFEKLSEQADLTNKALLVGLREATHGFVTDTKLMADGAKDLSSILANNKEALENYAHILGTIPSLLTAAQEKQAVMNDAIKKAEERTSGLNSELLTISGSWTKATTAIGNAVGAIKTFIDLSPELLLILSKIALAKLGKVASNILPGVAGVDIGGAIEAGRQSRPRELTDEEHLQLAIKSEATAKKVLDDIRAQNGELKEKTKELKNQLVLIAKFDEETSGRLTSDPAGPPIPAPLPLNDQPREGLADLLPDTPGLLAAHQDAQDRINELRIQTTMTGLDREHALEMLALKNRQRDTIQAMQDQHINTEELEGLHLERLSQLRAEHDAADLAAAKSKADAEQALLKLKVEAERAAAFQTAQLATALFGELFGNSKALAIANTIINTAEAAMKAHAQLGIFGGPAAAIIIATGAAQIAKIKSTKAPQFAHGGIVPGQDRGVDSVQAFVRPGEGILTPSTTRAIQRDLRGGGGSGPVQRFQSGGIATHPDVRFRGGGGSSNITLQLNIPPGSVIDRSSIEDLFENHPEALTRGLRRAFQLGERI